MRLLIAALALGACTSQPAGTEANTAEPANAAAPSADTPAAPPLAKPAASGNAAAPAAEAPVAEAGAEAAAEVVRSYYALIGAGRYGEAYRLWEPGAAGMDARAFAARFGRYGEYRARVGAPGEVDAGAGQRYVTVPVQVEGRLREGDRPFRLRGQATLHRVADIDGATAEQKRWRIRGIDLSPGAGAADAPAAAEGPRRVAFRCIDGSRLAATFAADQVTLVRGGRTLVLRQQPSGSGIRYGDGRVTFSGKGDDMTFEAPGQPPLPCAPLRR